VQMQTSKSYSSAALSEPVSAQPGVCQLILEPPDALVLLQLGPEVAQAINDFESSLQVRMGMCV
jgi:hypothetical protein